MTPSAPKLPDESGRPHTGRVRNQQAREAILNAAITLVIDGDSSELTIDRLARAAGVGRQTIYRWWPSKGAVLLEAMTLQATREVPNRDRGSLREDLRYFLSATFAAAAQPANARLLREVMTEALRDAPAAAGLAVFTADRRHALKQVLARARRRGELTAKADLDLAVDQAFGVLWYRLLLDHGSLTRPAARKLADALTAQLTADG